MILEEIHILAILISEEHRQRVKNLTAFNPQRSFFGMSDTSWCSSSDWGRNCQPTSSVAPLPLDIISTDKTLANLPEEANLVVLPPSLLAVDLKLLQLLPVVQSQQSRVLDPVNEVTLDRLQGID